MWKCWCNSINTQSPGGTRSGTDVISCDCSTQVQVTRAAASLWHHQAAVWQTFERSPLWSVRGHEEPATTSPTSTASGWPGWSLRWAAATARPSRWLKPGSRGTTSASATCAWESEQEENKDDSIFLPSCLKDEQLICGVVACGLPTLSVGPSTSK